MSTGATLAEALLITLASPATWPLALATFLLRGGLLVVLLPIVVLPSPVGLGNVLGPALTTVVLSGLPVDLLLVAAGLALAVVAWLVLGGLVAAILEAEGVRVVDRHADVAEARTVFGILAARLIAHAPTAVALAWGTARLVSVTYGELTSPSDVVSPIVLRVLRGAPEAVLVIVAAWMLGEIVGGLATRRLLRGAGIRLSLREAAGAVVRAPLTVLVRFWVPAVSLGLVLLPGAAAAAVSWRAVRVALDASTDPIGPILAVMLFVAMWLAGLLVIAVASAWRAAVWSVGEHGPAARQGSSGVFRTG